MDPNQQVLRFGELDTSVNISDLHKELSGKPECEKAASQPVQSACTRCSVYAGTILDLSSSMVESRCSSYCVHGFQREGVQRHHGDWCSVLACIDLDTCV